MNKDFFVGWSGEAPKSYVSKGRMFFLGSLIAILLAGVLFVFNQSAYIDSRYEFGTLTEVTGQLVEEPVWGLRIEEEENIKTIPLIGFGKMGPEATLTKIMEKHDLRSGLTVTFRGTLAHYQGKTLMELTEMENSLVSVGEQVMLNRNIKEKGFQKLEGEIVDPKCFFGVMNPAYKAVHRSCAILCISGGIPPVLAIRENGKFVDYYFLNSSNKKALIEKILHYVGVPVKVSGQVVIYDDWKSMIIDPTNLQIDMRQTSGHHQKTITMCY